MFKSQLIKNAQNLNEVVKLINNGTVENVDGFKNIKFRAEELAGQYAAEAKKDDQFFCSRSEELENQLTLLIEAGAKFNFAEALNHALI